MADKEIYLGKESKERPLRTIKASAPVRICDNGGWTDTWFAKYGKIFNIGVTPYAFAALEVFPVIKNDNSIVLSLKNYSQEYAVPRKSSGRYQNHDLLEAAIQSFQIPEDCHIKVTLESEVPAACSAGTSAAVSSALLGCLLKMFHQAIQPQEIAYLAHNIETKILKKQCGIQDQLCAVYGGLNYIEMDQYPRATVTQVPVSPRVWQELEGRLCLIYLGKGHSSSAIHEMVIADLEGSGSEDKRLVNLRTTAPLAVEALIRGNFIAFGEAMNLNNRFQYELHPKLIPVISQEIWRVAQKMGALGLKVNGAGGEGGSVTILGPNDPEQKKSMVDAIQAIDLSLRNIPVTIDRHGLTVWEEKA